MTNTRILDNIDSPQDLKKLSLEELPELASEIRNVLIEKMSRVGGHLGSNLGAVELTIAMHYVFDFPKDKLIFDVSHQCYTHKILTGRKNAFLNPEEYNSVCGYTNPDESEYDLFRVGHSSTSVSLACGMAKARDLHGGKENIVAVIGDGALSGGEAFEGLDYGGGEIKGNLIVILNDNQMSIAEDHGGIYGHLKDLRDRKGKCRNNIFRDIGYDYRFVNDGHDFHELIDALKYAKDKPERVLIHVCTVKGKGFIPAEENKEKFHWARPFDLKSGISNVGALGERYDLIVRDYLLDKVRKDPKVTVSIAAVPGSLSFDPEIREQFGSQFIDVGIAEEHAVTMLAGLSKNGCKPVFVTLSTFYQRAYDQIIEELCINNLPATMVVANASVYATNDVTHVGLFDIPMMSNLPNLVYLAPTNKEEYLAMLDWSIEQKEHPVAVRAPRNGVFHATKPVDRDYSNLNKFKIERQGEKIAVIALGDFFQLGESLVDKIKEHLAISATLVNPRYITGLDCELLDKISEDHNLVITLEDGMLDGGFGQKIASYLGPKEIKVLNYGLKKEFLDRYNVDEVLKENRLREDLIIEDLKKHGIGRA